MNNHEAVKILRSAVAEWGCAPADEYPIFTDKLGRACNLAMSALEKQIPKKPIRYQPTYNFISCPVCNTDLIHTKNYCTCCGQAIDWRVKNE